MDQHPILLGAVHEQKDNPCPKEFTSLVCLETKGRESEVDPPGMSFGCRIFLISDGSHISLALAPESGLL